MPLRQVARSLGFSTEPTNGDGKQGKRRSVRERHSFTILSHSVLYPLVMRDRLYLRGKIWWCWYYDKDRKVKRETTTCTDREAARLVLRRKENAQQDPEEKPGYVSLDSVLTDLETWTKNNRRPMTVHFVGFKTKRLREGLGKETDINGLTLRDLEEYVEKRKIDVAPATIGKELAMLRYALTRARKKGRFSGDIEKIFPEYRTPYRPKKRWLSREEYEKLLGEFENPARKLWIITAVYTGARMSELEGLTWKDVRGSEIHVRGTKTERSDRIVPLHEVLKDALGERGIGKLVPLWGKVNRDLKAACKRAKIDPVSPNDLRRTFASWLLQAGVTSSVVAALLGHTTTTLVDLTYGKLDQGTLREAVGKI